MLVLPPHFPDRYSICHHHARRRVSLSWCLGSAASLKEQLLLLFPSVAKAQDNFASSSPAVRRRVRTAPRSSPAASKVTKHTFFFSRRARIEPFSSSLPRLTSQSSVFPLPRHQSQQHTNNSPTVSTAPALSPFSSNDQHTAPRTDDNTNSSTLLLPRLGPSLCPIVQVKCMQFPRTIAVVNFSSKPGEVSVNATCA